MIPGEIDHRRRRHRAECRPDADRTRRRQHRRPADPGRQPLPFRRNQPGAVVRPGGGARPAPGHRRRHRRAVRAGADARGDAGALPGRTHRARVSRRNHGSIGLMARITRACLCRHVRPDRRRPRAACRHRALRRGGEGFHRLRRRGEVRRRQGDPRRHGPVAAIAGRGRGRHRHHQRADHRPLGHRQGRCRHRERPHRARSARRATPTCSLASTSSSGRAPR